MSEDGVTRLATSEAPAIERSAVMRRTLVAGIGNVFLSDDGFGSEVAQRLLAEPAAFPAGVEVVDVGIRGLHLAHQLLDGYDRLVIVDAVPLGDDPPGTVVVFEPDPAAWSGPPEEGGDAHGMDPLTVLRSLHALGGAVGHVVVVGCQPGTVDEGMGLTPAVAAAVEPAAAAVRRLCGS